MVRERVVRVGNADLGIGAVAGLARELERDDAGDVALERQHLQVEHQPGVVGVGGRHADRAVEVRQRVVRRVGLGLLNAALHFADGVQVLVDLGAVGRAELSSAAGRSRRFTESSRLARLPQRGAAFGRAAAFAEQPLEDDPRMRLAGSGVVGDDHERLF